MKKNMILLMAVLLLLCWYTTVGGLMNSEKKYQENVKNAESFEERELYLDAIAEYQSAMQYRKDTSELLLKIAYDYRALGDMDSYITQLKSIVSQYGPRQEAVKNIYDYYSEKKREDDAIEYIAGLKEKYPEDAVVEQYYTQIRKNYYALYHSFQLLNAFLGEYAVYEYEGKKGIVDSAGEIILEAAYDEIQVPLKVTDGFPVKVGNQVYMISEKGYKIAQPEDFYDELGILSGSRIVARKNGKYGYLDKNLEEMTEFVWDDATNFSNKIAAVKSKDKWALINTKGEFLTDYIYSDVKRDSNNFCSRYGLLWVNEGNGYKLINTELEIVCEEVYEDARCFYEEGPGAVCQNGRWGFVDRQGQEIISPVFEDADSFQRGYAPVKKNGLWGYTGEDGEILIDYVFEEALGFNEDGSAPVKRGEAWELIKLGIYK